MKHFKPGWVYFFLAISLAVSSCTLFTALRPSLAPRSLPATSSPAGPSPGGSALPSFSNSGTSTAPALPQEQPVILIPLDGPASSEKAEISGLAWFGDQLLLLPQYPERMSDRGEPGVLFVLPESDILAFLDGKSQGKLTPSEIQFVIPDLKALIPDYEGFEAIAFAGDRIYLTIESGEFGPAMSYLIAGSVDGEIPEIRLDAGTLMSIPPQADLINRGEEALVSGGDHLLSLFETNGARIVPEPVAHRIDLETYTVETLPFPNVEYRITDATPVDANGRFWALNTYFPGDFFVIPLTDPIANRYGEGSTHSRELAVERLLQFQLESDGISLVDTPPIQLELLDSFQGRNWEGLAELPARGFLVVTDRQPETILAFVPYP